MNEREAKAMKRYTKSAYSSMAGVFLLPLGIWWTPAIFLAVLCFLVALVFGYLARKADPAEPLGQ